MAEDDNTARDVSEQIERLLSKAGFTETDVTETATTIRMLQEVTPIGNGEQYRAYEERYRNLMQDAGFVGHKRGWEEYMDYIRTPAGRLSLVLFNRMAEWKKEKGVP